MQAQAGVEGPEKGEGPAGVNASPWLQYLVLLRGNGVAQGLEKGAVKGASGFWCWESPQVGRNPVLQGNGQILLGCVKRVEKETRGSILVSKCGPRSNALTCQAQQRSQK